MNTEPSRADPALAEPERRRRVLDAAQETFWRFGFRKTSMDEVARRADISRQGLYFYFGNKEDLFREAMRKSYEDSFATASARISALDASIEDRLIGAMDAWIGCYVGKLGEDASDLREKSALLGGMAADYSKAFEDLLAQEVAASHLSTPLSRLGLTPEDVVRTLVGCGVGWKHLPITREEFVQRMTAAVWLICRWEEQ